MNITAITHYPDCNFWHCNLTKWLIIIFLRSLNTRLLQLLHTLYHVICNRMFSNRNILYDVCLVRDILYSTFVSEKKRLNLYTKNIFVGEQQDSHVYMDKIQQKKNKKNSWQVHYFPFTNNLGISVHKTTYITPQQ